MKALDGKKFTASSAYDKPLVFAFKNGSKPLLLSTLTTFRRLSGQLAAGS